LEHEPSIGFRKVYLMTLTEQKEMDAFLEEALATGHIRQSKLPLGALVFFIQDYHCSGYQSFGISKINYVLKAFTHFKECKFCGGGGYSGNNKPNGCDLSGYVWE
jgi:hypothetical protein